ncbi:MAG: RNA polymerase sigma-70 factor [Parabacteroides sp.]
MTTISIQEFEQHFKQLYQPLCLFALRYTEQVDDAEDIVQQVFTEVWEKNRTGEAVGNLKSYLYQAVKNRVCNLLKAAGLHPTTDQLPELEETSDEERIRLAERDARLWNAIDRLPPMRKQIFLLAKRDGLKQQEIADELHISIKTVEAQLSKAIQSLKDTLVRIYLFFFG